MRKRKYKSPQRARKEDKQKKEKVGQIESSKYMQSK